jgi:hypothetical protein
MSGAEPTGVSVGLVPGRDCDGCTLCCNLMRVEEIAKPRRQWCRYCFGTGCAVYERRPVECRRYACGYLHSAELGEHWHPKVSGMIVLHQPGGHVFVFVDPHRERWQDEPYSSELKAWAAQAVAAGRQVRVELPGRTIVVLPERHVDVGRIGDDDSVLIATASRPGQPPRHFVVKKHKDEPDKGPAHWL